MYADLSECRCGICLCERVCVCDEPRHLARAWCETGQNVVPRPVVDREVAKTACCFGLLHRSLFIFKHIKHKAPSTKHIKHKAQNVRAQSTNLSNSRRILLAIKNIPTGQDDLWRKFHASDEPKRLSAHKTYHDNESL